MSTPERAHRWEQQGTSFDPPWRHCCPLRVACGCPTAEKKRKEKVPICTQGAAIAAGDESNYVNMGRCVAVVYVRGCLLPPAPSVSDLLQASRSHCLSAPQAQDE